MTGVAHRCDRHARYDLTCEEWTELQEQAGGACMCCLLPTLVLITDHDHSIGRHAVRGLVCAVCNRRLSRVDAGLRGPTAMERAYLDERTPQPRYRHYRKGDPLAACAEVCDLLGLSRQRVDQLTEESDFPPPVAHLHSGRIWLREDIVAWAEAHGRPIYPADE